jgi:penicillin-insensitive murein endopeptidase
MLACGRQAAPRARDSAELSTSSNAKASPDSRDVSKHHSVTATEPDDGSSLDDEVNDEVDESEGTSKARGRPHPFDSMSEASLREAFESRPESLGSISIGTPNSGQLLNGVQPKESPLYHLVDPSHAWGTEETVDYLCHALSVVARLHPGTPAVDIGHLSAKVGGPIRPHHSHQSGRDVDLGLYYRDIGTRWYTHATRDTLDVPRTWTLIRTLVTDTDIEMILLDQSLQDVIKDYAQSVETETAWVSHLFHTSGARAAVVRHSPGHTTHMHLRFFNPIAQQSAKRLAHILPSRRIERVSTNYVVHVATSGDTLAKLASRYHTTIGAIRQANRMHDFQLFVGHRYNIPVSTSSTTRETTRLSSPSSAPRRTSN